MPTKVCLVKAMVFHMYGYESWTINKAENRRIEAFKLWCWKRFLRVPWIAERSNQSTLKEINPKYSLEGLMLKLKLQYFGHLLQRAQTLEKTLMLGKIESRRQRGWQRMSGGWHHRLDGHEFEQTPGAREGQGSLACCSPWGCTELDTTERLSSNNLHVCVLKSLSLVWLFTTPWTVAHQVPLFMGLLRLEYWSGLPLPPPEDLPNPGTKPMSPASPAMAGGCFTTETPGRPRQVGVKIGVRVFGVGEIGVGIRK